jgi:cytochrome P450
MGMPHAMLPDFIAWENGLMRGTTPAERVTAARSIYAYLEAFLSEQRRHPGNEFLKGIVEGEYHDRPLEHLEAMGMLYVLYVGGLDTVYSALGWIMRHLATHPELQRQLRDNPERIPAAVEEFSRAFSVVVTHREVREDYVFHGVPLRKGDEINMPIALANRDPRLYENPHLVDIDRKSRHINFGTGTHNCIGIHLAKRELCTVIEEFLASFRNIRIREGEHYRFHTGRTFGLEYLPIEWDPA